MTSFSLDNYFRKWSTAVAAVTLVLSIFTKISFFKIINMEGE